MATYYVDSSAGGGGNGSVGTPWNTLGSITGLAAGDLIHIKGSFTGAWTLGASGSAGDPITFQGYTTTVGDGGTFTVTGGSPPLDVSNRSFVVIKNAVFTTPTSGSYLMNSNGGTCTFVKCTFSKGGSSATGVDSGLGTSHYKGCTFNSIGWATYYGSFEECTFNSAPAWAIDVQAYRHVHYVINCRFYQCVTGGVRVPANGQLAVIHGNTFYDCGIAIQVSDASTLVNISGNLFSENTNSIDITTSNANVFAYKNGYYNTGTQDSGLMSYYTDDDVTCSASPITDPTTSWNPNTTSGGGPAINTAMPSGKAMGAGQYVGSVGALMWAGFEGGLG